MRVDYPPHDDLDGLMHPDRALRPTENEQSRVEASDHMEDDVKLKIDVK